MVSVAAIGTASGIATGLTTGTTTITYTNTYGCIATKTISVVSAPAAITGSTDVCVGSTTTLADATTGGTWSSSAAGVATVDATTGVVTGVAAGTTTITYTLSSGCYVTHAITVDPLPVTYTLSSSSSSCGSAVHIILSGSSAGVIYQLYNGSTAVGSAISGTGSAIDFGIFSTAGTYVATAASATTGCTTTMSGSVTISGNIISGDISFSSTLPDTLDMKVWLIQYDATDSSLMATDSVLTCLSGSTPHYEFSGKPSGNYMVKAKLIYGNPPGSTGYIPTYGASSIHWDSASTIVHTGGTSTQNITMIHGTVPAGPGFIGGLIVSGAGRGTTGEVPYAGMLVYLKDAATGNIITYTYSSSTGAYSFSGIAYGSYIVDPVEYHYYTTPSSVITLSASTPSVTTVNFKRRITYGTIVPFLIITTGGTNPASSASGLSVYPNPASNYLTIQWNNQAMGNATAVITDVTGREVFKSTFEMNTASGQTQLSLPALNNGMYIMSIKSNGISYTERLTVEQ